MTSPGSPDSATPAPSASPRRRGRLVTLTPLAAVTIVLAVLVVGVMVGLFMTRSFASETSAELERVQQDYSAIDRAHERLQERNLLLYSQVESLQGQLDVANGAPVGHPVIPPDEPGTYSDGIYRVGEDIPAGTYSGVVTGLSGYWARLNSTTGTFSSIVANGVPQGDFVLTIYPSDTAVELRGVVLTGPEE